MEEDNNPQANPAGNANDVITTQVPKTASPVNTDVLSLGLNDVSEAATLGDPAVLSGTTPQDLSFIVNNARQQTIGFDLPTSKFAQKGMDQSFNSFLGSLGNDDRLNPVDYNVNLNEVYTPLSDGTYIPKFDNYISGTNNEERLALQQGTMDKWVNGITKNVFSKTALNVLDGTIGTIYGLANGIAQGSFASIYDNSFSNFIDDLNKRLDSNLPNYYTQQEKDKGFLSSLGTANFWANDFAGGMSFMFGTIISEAIWAAATGGASLATFGARAALKAGGKSLAKGALHSPTKLLNAYMRTIPAANTARALNNARFLYTSAGYEAGVEARHYMNEQEENFIQSYQQSFGRRPDPKTLASFKEDLTSSANTLFAANVALVGSSNIAQFGTYFGLQAGLSKSVNKYLGKKVGLGVTSTISKGKDVFNALDATPLQRNLGRAFFVAKGPLVEGFVEEGGQAALSGTGERWLSSKYNPEALKENYGLIEAAYDSFSHTYGSKEGFKEIGLGALIGLFGQSGRGFNLREYDNKAQANIDKAQALNSYSNEGLIEKLAAVTQQKSAYFDALSAQDKGEVLRSSLDMKRGLFSKMMAEYNADLIDDSHENFKRVIESTPDESIAQQFGVDESAVDDIRQELLEDYETSVDDFKKSIRVAESILPPSLSDMDVVIDGQKQSIPNSDIRSLLALNLYMGKNSDRLAGQYAKEIGELLGDEGIFSALEQKRQLERVGKDTLQKYNKTVDEIATIDKTLSEDNDIFIEASISNKSPEAKQAALEKAAVREEQLIAKQTRLQNRRDELNSELQKLSDEIVRSTKANNIVNQEFTIPFGEDVVNPETLIEMGTKLQELEDTLSAWQETSPEAHDRIAYLLDQYRKAEFSFLNVNEGFSRLSNEKFRTQEVTSIFGKVFSKINAKKSNSSEYKEFTANTYAFLADSFYKDQALFNPTEGTNEGATDGPTDGAPQDQAPDDFPSPAQTTNPTLDINEDAESNPLLEAINKRVQDIIDQRKSLTSFDPEGFSKEDVVLPHEIEEYKNLLRKKLRNENGLRPQDIDRFKELKLKINNYGRLQGTVDSGSRLSDLLQQSVLLQDQIATELNTQVDSNTRQALRDLVDPEFSGSKSSKNADNSQTYDKAFVKREFNGDYSISNINIQGVLDIIGKSTPIEIRRGRSKGLIQSIDSISNVKPGDKFSVTLLELEGTPKVTFKISKGNNVVFSQKTRDILNSDTKLSILPTSNLPTSYQTLLQDINNEDGSVSVVPVDTNFTLEKGVFMNQEALSKLNENDEVFLEVSLRNDFNKILFSNIEANQELDKATRNSLQDNMVIYVKTGSDVVAVLKRGENLVSSNDSNLQALNTLRQKALDKVLEERISEDQVIDLETTIPVNFSYLGHPNFNMVKENNEVKVLNRGFDTKTLDKVIDLGFIKNGKLDLNKGVKGLNTIYVDSYSRKNAEVNIPVIVFRFKGKKIVYPVSLQPIEQDLSVRVDEILSTNLPVVEKVDRLNTILASSRIDVGRNGFYYNNSDDNNLTDAAHITKVKDLLTNVKDYPDVAEWANGTLTEGKELLRQQGLININISDNPFHSPKLKLKITDFSVPTDFNEAPEVVEQELTNDLAEEVEQLQKKDCN